MKAAEFLQIATDLVGGARNAQHGDAIENHEKIATLWDAWLRVRREPGTPLSGLDVACMMVLLKAARTQLGNYNSDDFTDMAGYAGVAGEIAFDAQARR